MHSGSCNESGASGLYSPDNFLNVDARNASVQIASGEPEEISGAERLVNVDGWRACGIVMSSGKRVRFSGLDR